MKINLFAAFMLFAVFTINSQETIPTSGGEATGSGGSSSYTVGQIVYNTYTDATGSVSHGIQHAFEFLTLSSPELTALFLSSVVYPNPTTDYILLSLKDSNLTGLTYTMYDLQARVVTKGKVQQEETQIPMQHLATGTYILKVNQDSKALKTFKIIKK